MAVKNLAADIADTIAGLDAWIEDPSADHTSDPFYMFPGLVALLRAMEVHLGEPTSTEKRRQLATALFRSLADSSHWEVPFGEALWRICGDYAT